MSEEGVEELEKYTRRELDEIAESLGLKSADYPNKSSVAQAILKAREEQRETERIKSEQERERMEREREVRVQELKKKMSEKTVKGKKAAIEVQTMENQQAITKSQSNVQQLLKKFQAYSKESQSNVQQLLKKFQAYSKELQKAVADMQTSIKEQTSENQAFIKNFYG